MRNIVGLMAGAIDTDNFVSNWNISSLINATTFNRTFIVDVLRNLLILELHTHVKVDLSLLFLKFASTLITSLSVR